MADRPKKSRSGANEKGDVPPAEDLFNKALADLYKIFAAECGKKLSDEAKMYFGALVQKTIGAAIDKGKIKEWEAEQKAYVYPHVRGIAARICGDCDADEITPKMLDDAADPWIKDARTRASSALIRLAGRLDKKADSDELAEVRLFLTVYCDDYS